jgi:hypothetical protein
MRFVTALAALLVVLGALPAAAQEQSASFPLEAPATESDADEEPVVVEPLGSRALRSDLRAAGYRNGELPGEVLAEVEAGANERCWLEADAAVAWQLLLLAAEAEGVSGFAAGWCYRSLEQQERTYDRNCPWVQDPAPPVEEGEEPLPPPPPYRDCRVPTAEPGTSNHGWGRAIDVVDTTTRKAHILSCGDPQYVWLRDNAIRFGWVAPSWAHCGAPSQEPWHFEWAGLSIPITQLIVIERAARGAEVPL